MVLYGVNGKNNQFRKNRGFGTGFFSQELVTFIRDFKGVVGIIKRGGYVDNEGDFKITQATVVFRSGKVKVLPEMLVALPVPGWIDSRGESPSFTVSAWRYMSQAKKEANNFLRLLDAVKNNNYLVDGVVISKDDLEMQNFSDEMKLFIGDFNQVKDINDIGLIQEGGGLRRFPEPVICLPCPDWVNAVAFDIGDEAELQPVWMMKSQAEKELAGFTKKIDRFLNFQG